MRRKIVAGNWKMNLKQFEARNLMQRLKEWDSKEVQLAAYVPYIHLERAYKHLRDNLWIGAQNCHQESKGAYTGEISAPMLKSFDCHSILLGHSERRKHFNESNEVLKLKVNSVLENEMNVMFCIGETLEEREQAKEQEVVKTQLEQSLFHLSKEQMSKIVIAYEPVWAIGTGKTASPAQAQDMHAYIRSLIANTYDEECAQNISILYGGSVKPSNAVELFAQNDIDGGLIGGASLVADDFFAIANSFS